MVKMDTETACLSYRSSRAVEAVARREIRRRGYYRRVMDRGDDHSTEATSEHETRHVGGVAWERGMLVMVMVVANSEGFRL
jgi:hypothetical protein